ncbi:CHAT domain-containing protein [Leptolyngbya sp. AN02str]|uniref:CHAT domain-containing protein n=1 Tax=Leptolyngbya sp. AN02str TaxID=3423363 RepID=UPI003D321610
MVAPVSVVILCYNRERYLAAAIASVLAQTYRNFELLIWDDGSSDRSVEIAQQYAQQDARIRVVAAPHLGKTAARKASIAATSGPYIGWVDSDDLLAPTALERTIAVLNQQPVVGMVYSNHWNIDAEGHCRGLGQRCTIPYSKDRLLLDFMTFHFRLMRRSVFEQAGGIDASCEYAYDYDLCLRLSEITEIYHLQEPLYYYRTHPGSMSSSRRMQQIWGSYEAVNRALKRRGLSDRYVLDLKLQVHNGRLRERVSLKPRQASLPKARQLTHWQQAGAALLTLTLSGAMGGAIAPAALAQSILPAADGTGSAVNQTGNTYTITGGSQSGNGANLFHSFERFGISENEIANFQSNPALQNILTRVVGGDASVIDGLLRVSNGNANLFFMNPAGVIFGSNAQLDLPASFFATTATGIGFTNGWFSAAGANDYSILTGNPSNFAFTLSQPGALINAGNLTVNPGQNLTLLGGTAVNTGTLTAPNGTITLAAVPGTSLVRISQTGSLLSLEVDSLSTPSAAAATEDVNPIALAPQSLPQLLTGGSVTSATGLMVNPDGSVQLTGSGLTIPTTAGTAIASGTINASTPTAGTPEVNVLGDRIGVMNATITANAPAGGGTLRIGGDYQGNGNVFNATRTIINSSSTLSANATQTGNGGNVFVWADDLTVFDGTITATGGPNGGNGGFVEVSGKQTLSFNGQVDVSAFNGAFGTLLLDPENIIISTAADDPATVTAALPDILLSDFPGQTITINATTLASQGGNIILQAANNITFLSDVPTLNFVGDGEGPPDSVTFEAGGAFNAGFTNFITNGASFTISAASILTNGIDTEPLTIGPLGGLISLTATGGNITTGEIITAGGAVTMTGASINTQDISTGNFATGGNLSLTATGGDIITGFIGTDAGDVTIDGSGNVSIFGIFTDGGAVDIDSFTITTGDIETESFGFDPSGDVTLIADGDITTGDISTLDASGAGYGAGDVTVQSTNGNLVIGSIETTSVDGIAGNVVLRGDLVAITDFIFDASSESITPFSIWTEGANGDGIVDITHAGGPLNIPFEVASLASPLTNGTVGFINTGAGELTAGSFPVLPVGGSATLPLGAIGITIQSVNSAPTLLAGSTSTSVDPGDSATFVLSFSVADLNLDVTVVRIASIALGGTLTRGGVPLAVGDTVLSTDVLVFTPAPGTTEPITAFTIEAGDLNNNVPVLATSTPVEFTVSINPPPPPPPPPPPFDPPVEPVPDRPDVNPPPDLLEPSGRSRQIDTRTSQLEEGLNDEFSPLGDPIEFKTLDDAQNIAQEIEQATGVKPAFIYISFLPAGGDLLSTVVTPNATDELELVLVTSRGGLVRRRVPGVTREQVMQVAQEFRNQVTNPRNVRNTRYLASSQQLYQWFVDPLIAELTQYEIDNLVFLPAAGLRSLPYAAMHDGKQFVIERFSIGLMPSLSLTDTRYVDVRNAQVLAMGVSASTQGQTPLPAVPLELNTLALKLWPGRIFLDDTTTINNLTTVRQEQPFGIIHLATHADFVAGSLDESYIQLWNERLRLNEIKQLGWNDPPVELLVLSACRTALGDDMAELGFAGLAVQTGVKSAVASLWYVSDAATAALMTRFYDSLRTSPIKAEALRQAQLAMARGEVSVDESGRLQGLGSVGSTILPAESSRDILGQTLAHPYYWAAFTMIGNPW